jgi:hypothetical protein
MGKSMGNRQCEWICARLPLWVDKGDSSSQFTDQQDGGDLTAKDRRQIECHLVHCAACRREVAALERALRALTAAIAEPPVALQIPSLWPILERRIVSRNTQDSPQWPRAVLTHTDREAYPLGNLDDERPLHRAWVRDGIRELLGAQWNPASNRNAGLLLRVSAVLVVACAVVGLPVVNQQRLTSQSVIRANAMPLADAVAPLVATDEPQAETLDGDTGDAFPSQLADNELVSPRESPAPLSDPASGPKPLPRTRFGSDLEHGLPMPRDSRESKPVY